uniref:Uncharacterized protein n=1 Tax=Romanomermis culicivorax TaxID=13658 RepID=A0A915HN31_ROMCU
MIIYFFRIQSHEQGDTTSNFDGSCGPKTKDIQQIQNCETFLKVHFYVNCSSQRWLRINVQVNKTFHIYFNEGELLKISKASCHREDTATFDKFSLIKVCKIRLSIERSPILRLDFLASSFFMTDEPSRTSSFVDFTQFLASISRGKGTQSYITKHCRARTVTDLIGRKN